MEQEVEKEGQELFGCAIALCSEHAYGVHGCSLWWSHHLLGLIFMRLPAVDFLSL